MLFTSIVVEDWDDLAEARRRRDAREAAVAPAEGLPDEEVIGHLVYMNDTEAEAFDDATQDLRVPVGIAGANLLVWLVGRLFGVVELTGVAFFVSIGLLLAAYVLREWQRDRTALICLAGALPLPVTIVSLF